MSDMPDKPSQFRKPTLRDLLYSSKTFLAAAISLAIGFSAELENPYWAALTCYVLVNPSGAGAIRSKALFRFVGTIVGGFTIFTLTGLFGDQLGVLAAAYTGVLAVASYLFHINRTPISYLYFAVCITIAIAGLSNLLHPAEIYLITTARVSEICIGILVMTIVDSLIKPEPQTPAFITAIVEWRTKARDWIVEAVGADERNADDEQVRQALRGRLRDLVKGISTIDSTAIQLPFDARAAPPRGYHLDMLRQEMALLVADLAALELWIRPLRSGPVEQTHSLSHGDIVARWVSESPLSPDIDPRAHINKAQEILADLRTDRRRLGPVTNRIAMIDQGVLKRLTSTVRHWCHLSRILQAINDGQPLPPPLEQAARRAKPIRSIDYLAAALDLIPMMLAMIFTLSFWYWTAWSSGPNALLFTFVGTVFLVGQPIGKAASGLLVGLVIAFCFVFIYQFVILPRATTFETLIIALGCAMIPIGILMAQNMLGLVASTMTFSFLGLQNAYHADLEQSLQTLLGSVVGLLIAAIFLSLGGYDQSRFAARRLAAAARRDNYDIATATSRALPTRGRFLSLALYRLSLYLPASEKVAENKPLPRLNLLSELSIGNNLLELRRRTAELAPSLRRGILRIRAEVAGISRASSHQPRDITKLRALVESSLRDAVSAEDRTRRRVQDALLGLDFALSEMAEGEQSMTLPA